MTSYIQAEDERIGATPSFVATLYCISAAAVCHHITRAYALALSVLVSVAFASYCKITIICHHPQCCPLIFSSNDFHSIYRDSMKE